MHAVDDPSPSCIAGLVGQRNGASSTAAASITCITFDVTP